MAAIRVTNVRARLVPKGLTAGAAALVALPLWISGPAAQASTTLTVCSHGCAYTQVSAAVAAAVDGDTLIVGPGFYAGGFTIAHSITVAGAGEGRTIIAGGGPVITVGVLNATTEPTVTLRGVTISGGHTSSFDGFTNQARGGGVLIPPSADDGLGATVTIADSAITGNVAAPTSNVDAGFSCGDADCRFALAGGGGIDSWGSLTVTGSLVNDNAAAGVASDANGGGIYVESGPLVVDHSQIIDNRAVPTEGIARFAAGGGINLDSFFSGGTALSLKVEDSAVSDNTASLVSNLPGFASGQPITILVNGAGIDIPNGAPATIEHSSINGNTDNATDTVGEAGAYDAAVSGGNSPLVMNDDVVAGNHSTTTTQTTADIGPQGVILEADGAGSLDHVAVVDNTTTVNTPNGFAQGLGAVLILGLDPSQPVVTLTNSVIAGNTDNAVSATGSASASGGGLTNSALLDLRNDQVSGNAARAVAPVGTAQGGGIFNGNTFTGPPVALTVDHSSVTFNTATGSSGVTRQGGGLFTAYPVTLSHSAIAHNQPDECYGCSAAVAKQSLQPLLLHNGRRRGSRA